MKRLILAGVVATVVSLLAALPALADKPAPAPPAVTDSVTPGKACAHANLAANRNFGANHGTGVSGQDTPPTCGVVHVLPRDYGGTPTPEPSPGPPDYGVITIAG